MFKLVVLSALLALASAKPSHVHSVLVAPAVYAAPAVYGIPSAVSHQSRVDIHSSPALVSSYLTSPAVPAYSSYSAPLVSSYSAPQYVSSYSAPLVSAYQGHALLGAPSTLALAPNTPAVVTKATGVPLETIEVINARDAHYTAKALNAHGIHKRSVVSPLAYSAVYAPTAVSHQSRVDVHSSNVLAYSAPVVSAYSTPVVSAYSTPVVSAYSTPVVSAYSTPVVSSYSAPQYVSSYSAPLVSAYHGHGLLAAAPSTLALAPNTPAVVTKATGVPLETIEVINARDAHYTAKALNAHGIHKRSIASPLAYSAVYAPTAVSHQSRVDVHSSPVVAYSSPVVSAYTSPLVKAYSTPVLSAYSTPLLKSYTPLVSAYSSPLVSVHSSPLVSAYSSPIVSAHSGPAYSVHPW